MERNSDRYIFETEIKVRDYELDVEGIVNNANYLHYLELTRHEFCEQTGVSFIDMHNRGIDPVLRRVEIDYITPLRGGDKCLSRLNLKREGAKFVFVQDLFRASDEAPVVHAIVTCVTLKDGRLSRGDELAELFAKYL